MRERKASRVVCMCSVQTTDELSLRDGFSSIFAILSRSLCAFFVVASFVFDVALVASCAASFCSVLGGSLRDALGP